MTLVGWASLQLQRDPGMSVASYNCLLGLPIQFRSLQRVIPTWSSETQADSGFAFSAMASRLALSIDSPTNQKGKSWTVHKGDLQQAGS